MEHASEDAPLARDSGTGSEQALVVPTAPRRGSNSHAVKIAGITTLVCLLVSAQVFTAYMVFDQKQQIQGLQTSNQRLEKQMGQRPRESLKKIVMPANSMPILDFFDDGKSPQNSPKAEPPKQDVAPPSVEKQLQELMKDQDFPQMNESFLANLQTMKQKVSETDWKSFEAWMHYWLIFQMAQKTSTPTPQPDGGSK
ncbi:hypothetical protein NL108_014051 [Boleophthalmus pectinirostris]|uniref:HLA class II histocompatibility antigen gamma chain-like n=1 Tax=Boleophthalmus pectinirostris TaxID=150288 RepID=UPI000A1C4AE6|nr:HLA class II histocompatibility antigen gamma chain-like [Boleophthalmus pectinirostris]KAJ0050204.1 hypothetical protein NL108_014051 [Boleophthalmus pectinirostris]